MKLHLSQDTARKILLWGRVVCVNGFCCCSCFNIFELNLNEKAQLRTGEVVQQLRAPAVLADDPGSSPSTHMVAHKPSVTPVPKHLTSSPSSHGHCTHMVHRCTHRKKNTQVHKIKKGKKEWKKEKKPNTQNQNKRVFIIKKYCIQSNYPRELPHYKAN